MLGNWFKSRSRSGLQVVFGSLVGAFAINGIIAACGNVQNDSPDAGAIDSAIADTPIDVPLGETPGMIAMFTIGCPSGWVACDGTGSCPDFGGAYIKAGTAFESRTGSNSHTHTLSGLSAAAAGGHSHTASVSIPSAGGHSHVTHLNWGSGSIVGRFATTATWTATDQISLPGSAASSATTTAGPGTSTDGAHTHSGATVSVGATADHTHALSGTIASGSHEPEHVTLVLCMKAPD